MGISQFVIIFPKENFFNSIQVVIEHYTDCENKRKGNCSQLKTLNLVKDTLKALDNFKNKQKSAYKFFSICKIMFILEVYSIHYTLG